MSGRGLGGRRERQNQKKGCPKRFNKQSMPRPKRYGNSRIIILILFRGQESQRKGFRRSVKANQGKVKAEVGSLKQGETRGFSRNKDPVIA